MASAQFQHPSAQRRVQYEQRLDNLLTELSKVSGSLCGASLSPTLSEQDTPPPSTNSNSSNGTSNNYYYNAIQSSSSTNTNGTNSAPSIMYNSGIVGAVSNSRRAVIDSSPTSTFIVSSAGANNDSHLTSSPSKKHYCSQITTTDGTSILRRPRGSFTKNNSVDDPTMLVLSPPASCSGDGDSGYHRTPPHRSKIDNTKSQSIDVEPAPQTSSRRTLITTSGTVKTTTPAAAAAAAAAEVRSSGESRGIIANGGSREDTCDSTKYSSDTDTTMSGGSASGSNDFLSRLEQSAAKQPGTSAAPLPFSYLAMANNNGNAINANVNNNNSNNGNGGSANHLSASSPTINGGLMASSAAAASMTTSSRMSPPNNGGYYFNSGNSNANNQANRNGVDYHGSGYNNYDDDEEEVVVMNPILPPPPPPPPRPGQQTHHYLQQRPHQRPRQNDIYEIPANNYSSPAASVASPTSSSNYFQSGPGAGVFAHVQYNSPLGLYSNDSAAEAFRMQSGGVVTEVAPVPHSQQETHDFQSTPLYKLIQEEENRQQRRQGAFHRQGGQYSADEGFISSSGGSGGGYSNGGYSRNGSSNNSNEQSTPHSNRRITTMTLPRQRPGSSLAHFVTPSYNSTTRSSPKECYDQVLATLPRRPNRWSAKTESGTDADRQTALRARCSSATRCMNSSPSGVDESSQFDDRVIRYRGAKIPSRTFQLLHAYTEFTAKEEDDSVAPNKNASDQVTEEPAVVPDVALEKPRIRQRPVAEPVIIRGPPSHSQNNTSAAEAKDPSEFERGAIQGDGPPRPAVPSRSFLALQAVLNIQDKTNQLANNNNNSNNNDTNLYPHGSTKHEVENVAVGETGDQQKSSAEQKEKTNEQPPAESFPTSIDFSTTSRQQLGEGVKPNGELPPQFNGIIRQPAQQRQSASQSSMHHQQPTGHPMKIVVPPTRIRPSVPRAPTWDRRPFRHEVTSMRTPASKAPENYSIGPGNGYYGYHYNQQQPNGGGAFNDGFRHDSSNSSVGGNNNASSNGSDTYNNSDEPYRQAKLKVMTRAAPILPPSSAPRPIKVVQGGTAAAHRRGNAHNQAVNNGNNNNLLAHFGDATDF